VGLPMSRLAILPGWPGHQWTGRLQPDTEADSDARYFKVKSMSMETMTGTGARFLVPG
jgi:hypothetical protein